MMKVNGIAEEIAGILFDMDGLLVNSEYLYWQANIQAVKELNLEIPEDSYLKLIGASPEEMENFYHQYFKTKAGKNNFVNRTDQLVDQWVNEGKLKLRPGVQRALDKFQTFGLPMMVVSSNLENVIEHFLWSTGIRNYFSSHLSYDDVVNYKLRPKPAADIYNLAAQRINKPVKNLLAFEDSSTGVEAASRAGIKCVMIPELVKPSIKDHKNAVMVCRNFADFLSRI